LKVPALLGHTLLLLLLLLLLFACVLRVLANNLGAL
jgi:hypothetical protein